MARLRSRTSLNADRQRYVEGIFKSCLTRDERTLEAIRHEIRHELFYSKAPEVQGWDPTDYDLQIMVGRIASRPLRGGTDEWDYYPAYASKAEGPRFVSRKRVMELARKAEAGQATPLEFSLLAEMVKDLGRGIAHFRAAHATARQKESELKALVEDAVTRALGGESHFVIGE